MAYFFCVLGLSILWQILTLASMQTSTNACRECSRAPTSCRRISGLYTVTVLSEGTYNPVVVIPAPSCHINITEFSYSSNYIAIKTESDQGIINSYWDISRPGQFVGAGATFSYTRQAGSCRGTCIYSEGPTNEPVVVQILYYDKNPGIAYEFVLPNNVPFTPFDGTFTRQNPAAETETSSSLPAIRYQQHNNHHRRRLRQYGAHRGGSASSSNSSTFNGEYYTGSQYSRSEGRPDITSALHAQIGVKHSNHPSKPQQPGTYNYTGTRYGTHTLGGRGLSYTYLPEESQPKRQDYIDGATGRHVVERYRSGTNQLRRVASPQYVPPPGYKAAPSYAAQPHYQRSSSSSTSFLPEDNVVDDGYLATYNSQTSANQGHSTGSSQYRWRISGLTECSQSCGGGVQKTNIVCVSVSSHTQVVVTSENCASHLMPRIQTIECSNSPCDPDWEAEEWSECSVTCGSGTQTRAVECRQKFSSALTLKVSADQCRQAEKPAVAQQCEKGLCSQWKAGSWNECSKACGGGERRRTVRCVDSYESQIPVGYCTGTAPAEVESCNSQPCDSKWWLSDWSEDCSESCGQGVRSRSTLCLTSRGEVVSESLCDRRNLPSTQESCYSDADCQGSSWFTGPWGKCSAACGEGVRKRPVVCLQQSHGSPSLAHDNECNSSIKPTNEEVCVNTACYAVWYTSPWSDCSVTCGEGYRTRDVRCIEDNRQHSLRCPNSSKPDTHEVCTLAQCSPRYDYHRTNRNEFRSNTGKESSDKSGYNDGEPEELTMTEDVERTTGRENIQLPSTRTGEQRQPGTGCEDTYWNCLMVTQARLCIYDYYRALCCRSCQKV